MIPSPATDRKARIWWTRITSSLPRCHLLGSMTAVALLVCIAWVWSRSRIDAESIQYGDALVDLADAATLIDNADQWRQLYTVSYRRTQAIDQHVESIAEWLPTAVDWPSTEDDIRLIAESARLNVVSIKRGDLYVGTRVGVLSARCDVKGSYASLCRFLSGLSERKLPIACSEIDLHRSSETVPGSDEHPTPQCRATLSLRIPYAAHETTAGRLLMSETKHDS